jgi:hypothetical protein
MFEAMRDSLFQDAAGGCPLAAAVAVSWWSPRTVPAQRPWLDRESSR